MSGTFPFPLTLILSPNTRNALGERGQMVGTLTQGLTPRWGSIRKQRLLPLHNRPISSPPLKQRAED